MAISNTGGQCAPQPCPAPEQTALKPVAGIMSAIDEEFQALRDTVMELCNRLGAIKRQVPEAVDTEAQQPESMTDGNSAVHDELVEHWRRLVWLRRSVTTNIDLLEI